MDRKYEIQYSEFIFVLFDNNLSPTMWNVIFFLFALDMV